MMNYEELFSGEIRVLNEIISLADQIAAKISGLNSREKSRAIRYMVESRESSGEDRFEPW